MQHAILPTHLSLKKFYEELTKTQRFVNEDNLGFKDIIPISSIVSGNLIHGQANSLKMLVKFNSVYNPKNQLADHQQQIEYSLNVPAGPVTDLIRAELYVLKGEWMK